MISGALCPVLPISSVTMLLGNDIAGGRMVLALEILEAVPHVPCQVEDAVSSIEFHSCVIAHEQARRCVVSGRTDDKANVTLNNSLFSQLFADGEVTMSLPESPASETIRFPIPETRCELQHFLGMMGDYWAY